MHFSVEAAALQRAFTVLNPVIPRRSLIPITSNVLLRFSGERLEIVTNNLDQAMRIRLRAEGTAGEATVNGQRFMALVQAAPEGAQIGVSLAADFVDIKYGRSRFKLATLPVADFPVPPKSETTTRRLALQKGELAHLLAVGWAVSSEETRYYLCGVYLHDAGDEIVAVATDGHRLARHTMARPTEWDDATTTGGIIPTEAVRYLKSAVGDRACELTLSESAVEVTFNMPEPDGPVSFRSKLIDGSFPDYNRVIPASDQRAAVATIIVANLRAALKRCSVALSAVERLDKAAVKPKVAVTFTLHDGTLELRAAGDFGESYNEVLDIDWTGDTRTIGVNRDYFDGAAEIVDSEKMLLMPGDAGDPMRIEPESRDGRVYVVMPMRV
tara:strand:+ start:5625 stop:6776 length:1152 start_codon:yes stop_codon:yes gene_type:complete